jgi:hypothetical protein
MTDDKKALAADNQIVGFRVGPSEAGRWLIEAKEGENKLAHGEFEKMVQDDTLQLSPRTAQMLMEIARHPVISNAKHVSLLPPSWGTLYQLTRVETKALEAAIKDGRVYTLDEVEVNALVDCAIRAAMDQTLRERTVH